ncbi:hypothetical protein J6590_036255 [Homalodisca vitripennis]|nr:hypothetical protein J6590_036255 [Homalodisca vitripennis]
MGNVYGTQPMMVPPLPPITTHSRSRAQQKSSNWVAFGDVCPRQYGFRKGRSTIDASPNYRKQLREPKATTISPAE